MSETKLLLKTINDLKGKHFFIPSYQRGYRWTKQQVRDLLDDLNHFIKHSMLDQSDFYCLQPLVVTPVSSEVKAEYNLEHDYYEVIDGQQRLTTIYLILKACENNDEPFELFYQREKKYENEPEKKCLQNLNTENPITIDIHYISQAYKTIEDWFNSSCDNERNQFYEYLCNGNVRFIWYEAQNDENPIEIFTRLNIGKIPLTNSELIKALILNSSNFKDPHSQSQNSMKGKLDYKKVDEITEAIRLAQLKISNEWDQIESTLQQKEFWYFLCDENYKSPTHIDLIFDLVVKLDLLELNEDMENIGDDAYKTFRYFHKYFTKNHDNDARSTIENCWSVIKDVFQTFREWFDDLELYHYIGFLVACKTSNIIESLFKSWKDEKYLDKQSFVILLKSNIKTKILGPHFTKINFDNDDFLKVPHNQSDAFCKRVLLFHNIQTVINQNKNLQDNYKIELSFKFPFHFYKLENWDVEHINSYTDNDLDEEKSQREWLLNRYISCSEEQKKEIAEFLNTPKDITQLNQAFQELKSKFSSDTDDNWNLEDKNKLWNYVLLDSSTNRSYGNAIFASKRRVIIGKDKGRLIAIPTFKEGLGIVSGDESDDTSPFVPVCTKQVFLKYYSSVFTDSNSWTMVDAKAYLKDIHECLQVLMVKND